MNLIISKELSNIIYFIKKNNDTYYPLPLNSFASDGTIFKGRPYTVNWITSRGGNNKGHYNFIMGPKMLGVILLSILC